MILHAGSAAIHVTDVAAHIFDRVTEIYEQNVRRKKALKEVTAPPPYVQAALFHWAASESAHS
jgi:hypothetical protein